MTMKPTLDDTTTTSTTITPTILRYFLLSLFLSLPLLFLLSLHTSPATTTTSLRIRPGYTSYTSYLNHQLNKTLNPKLRHLWTTRDWDRKLVVFSLFFSNLISSHLLPNSSTTTALCIGARVGQEVAALRGLGLTSAVGIDLVPSPPLVIQADFHHQPFLDHSFDFEFSNVFDHALYPDKFVTEIQRTLRPGGICVLHVSLSHGTDKYSANDLYSIDPLIKLFNGSDLVRVRKIDGFGLDTEVVFRKRGKILNL